LGVGNLRGVGNLQGTCCSLRRRLQRQCAVARGTGIGSCVLQEARRSAWPSARRPPWSPGRNGSPAALLPALPPPSLKASGELQEKVPRVYTHMRRPIFGKNRQPRAWRGKLGLCGEGSRRPVFVSVYEQSLLTYICIVTLYGNNVCDH
ncbi:jg27218, partial [Pararge aegeria aegeria]